MINICKRDNKTVILDSEGRELENASQVINNMISINTYSAESFLYNLNLLYNVVEEEFEDFNEDALMDLSQLYMDEIGIKNLHHLLENGNTKQIDEIMFLWEDRIIDLLKEKDSYIGTIVQYLPIENIDKLIKIITNYFNKNISDDFPELFRETVIDFVRNFQSKDFIEFLGTDTIAELIEKLENYSETRVESRLTEEYKKKLDKGVDLSDECEILVNKIECKKLREELHKEEYLRALVLTKLLYENRVIDDQNPIYKDFRKKTILNLGNNLSAMDFLHNSLIKNLVNGRISLSTLSSPFNDKALIMQIRNNFQIPFKDCFYISNELSTQQVASYNIKLFRKLYEDIAKKYEIDSSDNEVRKTAFTLYLSCGHPNASKVVNNIDRFTGLEYLLNGVQTNSTKINETGEPILNKDFKYFVFKNTDGIRILRDMPQFFYLIHNKWDEIYQKLNGKVNLDRIKQLYNSIPIDLKPNEYKLQDPLTIIGMINKENIETAKQIYSIMKKRTHSTIPKIKGELEGYTYEILDLDDPTALTVGYVTKCCFLIDGKSASSLVHAVTNENGRIFIVKNDKGVIVAQSWIWRNGNLLCFDNVEGKGNGDGIKLKKVYKEAGEKLLQQSYEKETEIESLKVITVGASHSSIQFNENTIKRRPLPDLGNGIYSDARKLQYIIAGEEPEEIYLGSVSARYLDERENISNVHIAQLSDTQRKKVSDMILSINFELEQVDNGINLDKYRKLIYSSDWYIGITKDDKVDLKVIDTDHRALEECRECLKQLKDRNSRKGNNSEKNYIFAERC